jgi:CheY-like chemotaxis protein
MSPPSLDARAPKILIVDDEVDNRELLGIMLGSDGFVTRTANEGEEALLSVAADPPDVILVDLLMPGIDGYQLTARLKQNPQSAGIPVIILSAMNDSATRTRALGSGAAAYVTKPVSRVELCEQVHRVLSLNARPA